MKKPITHKLCLVFALFSVFLGVQKIKSVAAYQAANQENRSANNQAVPTVEPPLGGTRTPAAPNNASEAADKIRRSEWVQILISGFLALVILWQAWIYNQQRKIMKQQVETARISERAYIGIKMVETKNFAVGQIPVGSRSNTERWSYASLEGQSSLHASDS